MPPKNKVEPKKSRIVRFVDANDGLTVFINPSEVAALKEVKKQYHDPNAVATSVYVGNSYNHIHPDTLCIVYLSSGMQFQVQEHIAIVTALLKGEDPSPAEVIFGDN